MPKRGKDILVSKIQYATFAGISVKKRWRSRECKAKAVEMFADL
jgi:hypothetical protein